MTAGLLGWRAYAPVPPIDSALPPAAPAAARKPELPASARETVSAAAATTAPAGSVSSSPKGASSKEFVEVCGMGLMKRSELELKEGQPPRAWQQALEAQSEQEMAAVQQRLAAGSLKQRVAAAALRSDAEAAALMAVSTSDAQVYRMALRACRKDASYRQAHAGFRALPPASAASGFVMPDMPAPGPVPQACTALSLERLELLAPDDAWPWLARLNDSASRGDEAGVSQALYQIAQRQRLSANLRALSNVVAEVVGDEPTPGGAMALVMALGTDMAQMDASLVDVTRPCREASLRDANRRQLCEQVARRMPGMLNEALDASALHMMERRLGLPPSPQALSQGEVSRALTALSEDSVRWMDEPSCANFSRLGRQIVALGREGELAWVRAHLKRAGPASAPRRGFSPPAPSASPPDSPGSAR